MQSYQRIPRMELLEQGPGALEAAARLLQVVVLMPLLLALEVAGQLAKVRALLVLEEAALERHHQYLLDLPAISWTN